MPHFNSRIGGHQIWRASAIDPARLNTSNGAFPVMAFTVRGHESVIQKWENAFPADTSSQI